MEEKEQKRLHRGMKSEEELGKKLADYENDLRNCLSKFEEFEETIPSIMKDICSVYKNQHKIRRVQELTEYLSHLDAVREMVESELECF